jgi:hypothetical protein
MPVAVTWRKIVNRERAWRPCRHPADNVQICILDASAPLRHRRYMRRRRIAIVCLEAYI